MVQGNSDPPAYLPSRRFDVMLRTTLLRYRYNNRLSMACMYQNSAESGSSKYRIGLSLSQTNIRSYNSLFGALSFELKICGDAPLSSQMSTPLVL